MPNFLTELFSSDGFMPHGHCYFWDAPLVWTMVISDSLIGLAYVSISLSLYALVKKIKLPFSAMFLAFGVFIGACGTTHFMEVWTLWTPTYWLSALVKVVTALASVLTAAWLFPLAPKVVRLADTAKQAEEHRNQLQQINRELKARTDELALTNQLLAEQQKILAHSAKMSALGEMAGGIAHEINSPLGIITVRANQLERLQKRGQLTPELLTSEAKLIAATAKRIGDIIKGLRSFAREGEKDPFEFVPLANIVQDALVLCRTKFEAHDIRLNIGAISPGLELECRSVQISQVILNLLNNAYDAVLNLPEKWVEVAVKEEDDFITLSVTDSGLGIADEIMPKLMQPFFTTKEVGKGTGLGLSISKGIVESHQGTLSVDATHAHTRFVMNLPKKHRF